MDELTHEKLQFHSIGEVLQTLRTISISETLAIGKSAIDNGKKGIARRGYTLLQALLEERFFQTFMDQVEEMRAAGELRDNFDNTAAGVSSWTEFFKFIHGEPDDGRFIAFCALFMSANSPSAEDSAASIEIQLMQILEKLTAGQMQLFYACSKAHLWHRTSVAQPVQPLREILFKYLGHSIQSLVTVNMRTLVELGLVVTSWEQQLASTTESPRNILSDLGWELHHRILRYNEFVERRRGSAAGLG